MAIGILSNRSENPERRLTDKFYEKHVADVARALIGKRLVFGKEWGLITETEAYRGYDDAASHAYRGITPRNAVMFGPPGYTYVYMIYGIHHCLNIVTEAEHQASAVLIRSLKLPNIHLNGPGKICKYFGITREHNGMTLLDNDDFYITHGIDIGNIIATPRINISKAQDIQWRFFADID